MRLPGRVRLPQAVLKSDNQVLTVSETWILTHLPQRLRLLNLPVDYPNSDKPEQIATKAPRHKAKSLVNIHLWVFVSWWRKCFAIKCKEFTTKTLNGYLRGFLEQSMLGLKAFI
jgi:hypothetical protein